MEDKLQILYNNLVTDGYELPDYSTFKVDMSDDTNSKKLHDNLLKDGYDMPDYDTFLGDMNLKKKEQTIPNLLEGVLQGQKHLSEVGNKVVETPSIESGTQPQLLQSAEQPQPPQKKDTGSYLGDVFERMGAGALDWVTSGAKQANFARKLLNIPKDIVKKELGFLGVADDTAEKISSAMPFLKPPMIDEGLTLSNEVWNKIEKTDEFKAIEDKKAELQESSARYDQSIEQLIKQKDYKKAIGASFLAASESLPLTLTAMFGGPVGLTSLGMYSGATQYDQLSTNTDMNEAQKIANALVNGGLEIATEKLGSANYGKLIKSLYKTVGKEQAEQAVKGGLKNWFKQMFKRYGLYTAPLGEGVEELVNQFGGNITARATGEDPERSLRFGLTDATFAGIAGGTQITIMGLPVKVAQSFKPKKEDNAPPKPKEGEKVVEKKVTDMDYSFKGKEITKQDAEQLIDEAKDIDKLDGLKYKDDKVLDSRIRDKFNVQVGPLEVSKEVTAQKEGESPKQKLINIPKLESITKGQGYKKDGFIKLTDIISDEVFNRLNIDKSTIDDVYLYKLPLKETTGKRATFRKLNEDERNKVSKILGVDLPSNRVIELSSNADARTILHELAHVLRDNKGRDFNKDDIKKFEDSADRLMNFMGTEIEMPAKVETKIEEESKDATERGITDQKVSEEGGTERGVGEMESVPLRNVSDDTQKAGGEEVKAVKFYDALKKNNAPRIQVQDEYGNERVVWDVNRTDYFDTSDETGRKIRWGVELSDGRIVSLDGLIRITQPDVWAKWEHKIKGMKLENKNEFIIKKTLGEKEFSQLYEETINFLETQDVYSQTYRGRDDKTGEKKYSTDVNPTKVNKILRDEGHPLAGIFNRELKLKDGATVNAYQRWLFDLDQNRRTIAPKKAEVTPAKVQETLPKTEQEGGVTVPTETPVQKEVVSTEREQNVNAFDFTDTEKRLIQTATERRGEVINPQDIYDFAKKIAKQDNKPRSIEHTAEAINYASKTPTEFYDEKTNRDDGSLIDFVKGAIGNRALGDAQSARILDLNLNKEWNNVAKKINNAFLKIQEKTKGLNEQARRLLSSYMEYKSESLDDVLGILDYVKGDTAESIAESVYKWGEDKEMATIKATPWNMLSEVDQAKAVRLNENVYKHSDFKKLKSIVDKKYAQSQGKGVVYEGDMGLQWFYLNADYAEAKALQDKIAKDLGLTWYRGAVGGRSIVVPKPKGWKTKESAPPLKSKELKDKESEIKAKIAQNLEDLASAIGAIKQFTGEERANVLKIITDLIKNLADLTSLKGQQLYERLKEELKGKNIPEDVVKEAWDKSGFAEEVKEAPPEVKGKPKETLKQESDSGVPTGEKVAEKGSPDTKLRKTQTNSLIQDKTRQQEEVTKIVTANRDRYEVLHMGDAVDQAKALIDEKGVQGASLDLTKPTKVMLGYPKRNVARLILLNFYSKALIDPSSSDADKTTAYEWINKLQDIIAKENTSAGQGTAMMKIWKEMQPEGVLNYVKRKIQESNDKALQKVVEDATIGQRIDDLYNTLNDESKKIIDDILAGKDITGLKEKLGQPKEPPKKKTVSKEAIKREQDYRKNLLDQYKKSAKTVSVSAVGLSKEQIELGGNLVASYIREGYYRTQDIVNRLVDDFKSIGVTLAKDKVDDILNQNKDTKQTYKEYLTNVEAKAGVQKEVGKRIDEVIREHWSKKDELKRTLSQKLIDEAGLSEADASRLEKSILEQFDKMILERSEKQLTKILGTEKIPIEKKKQGVVGKMIDLINMGAMDKQLYRDLFAEKFNLVKLTEAHTAEILRLANNVQLASEKGWLERDATIRLAKYIYELYPKSKTSEIQDTWIAMAYANMLFGISTSVLNITSAGSNMSMRPIRDVTNLSKWLRMFKRAYKGDYDVYNPFGEMFYGPMIRGSAYGFDEAKEVFINGDLNNKYMEDVAKKGQFKVQPLERDKYGRAKRFKPAKVKIGNKTYDFNIFNAYKYSGRNLAAQDKFMLSTSYEVELAHILRDKLKNKNLTGKALTKEVMAVLEGERLDMKQLDATIEEEAKLFKKMTGEEMTQIEKNIRKRELIQEQLPITKEEKEEAERLARSNIFTDDRYGTIASLANAIGMLANSSPTAGIILKPFVPFTKVVGNVAEYMLDHTPYYGLLRAHGMSVSRLKRLWGNDTSAQMGDVGSRAYYEQMGRAWFGTLAFTTAMLLFMGKDDEDAVEISGGYNQEGFKKKGRENVLPPYTLRIGNVKIPYKNIPSLAVPFALIGNINDAMKSNMNEEELRDRLTIALLGDAVMNSVFMVKDMSFLDGVQRGTQIMSDAISGDTKKFEKIGERLIKSYLGFLTRPLPQNNNAIQQIWKVFDPTSYSQSEIKGMLAYAGGIQHFTGKPTIDQLGDTIKSYPGETLMPYTHWLNIKGKDERWKFLAKHNAIPNKIYNRTMQIETTTGIEKRKLEEDEFFYYTLGTGRMFSAELVRYMADEEKVAKRAKDIIERDKSNGETEKINGIQEDVDKLWKKAVDNAEIELFRWGSVKEAMPAVWELIKKHGAYKPYQSSKSTGEYKWSKSELYEFNNLVTLRYAERIKNYLNSGRVENDKKRGKFEERTDEEWSNAKEFVTRKMEARLRKNLNKSPK